MKISSTAPDLVERRSCGGPPKSSNGDVNKNMKSGGSLSAASKGKRKSEDGTRGASSSTVLLSVAHRKTDQPILIDDDPSDAQEWPACNQGPANKKIRYDKTIQDTQRPQAIHDLTDDQSRRKPSIPVPKPSSLNTARLSHRQLGVYNDILTSTIIDGVSYASTSKLTIYN